MLVWRVVKGLPWRRPGNSHWPLAFHAFPTLVETKRNPDSAMASNASIVLAAFWSEPVAEAKEVFQAGRRSQSR